MTMLSTPGPRATTAQGRYLYAIIDAEETDRLDGITGLDGAPVHPIVEGGSAVVVSEATARKIRPERRKLAAHSDVLKRLMVDHAVLPMAFGLVADDDEDVRRLLRLNREAFDAQLLRVGRRVEMGVRLSWDVPNIFEHILGAHPELGALRDQLFRGGRQPSQDEKIELGRRFDRTVEQDREACVDRVLGVLSDRCVEVAPNRPRNEREVMNLACLVDRDRLPAFEAGVYEAARLFDDRYAFDFNGPWPPYNFVDIELRTS